VIGGEGDHGLLLGPTDPSDADAEALGGGLERGGGVAVEAEAQAQHVALEFGEPVERAAHPVHQHPLVHVGGPVLRVRCHEVPERGARVRRGRLVEAGGHAGHALERAALLGGDAGRFGQLLFGRRTAELAGQLRGGGVEPLQPLTTSRGMRMVRPCCWTAR